MSKIYVTKFDIVNIWACSTRRDNSMRNFITQAYHQILHDFPSTTYYVNRLAFLINNSDLIELTPLLGELGNKRGPP